MLLPLPLTWQRTSFSSPLPIRRGGVGETQRLTRAQFERWFDNRSVALVVMEPVAPPATGHGQSLRGIAVRLLPAACARLCAAQPGRMLPMPPRCWSRTLWRHAPGGGEIGRATGAAGTCTIRFHSG